MIVFFVFRFLVLKFKDYSNDNKCNDNEFVADGGRFNLTFIVDVAKKNILNNFSAQIKTKQGILKKIKFVKDTNKKTLFYTDDKILKSDTLVIKGIKDKEYKVYDFKNDAIQIKAGHNRGEYYCVLFYKVNFQEMGGDNIGGNGILINTEL